MPSTNNPRPLTREEIYSELHDGRHRLHRKTSQLKKELSAASVFKVQTILTDPNMNYTDPETGEVIMNPIRILHSATCSKKPALLVQWLDDPMCTENYNACRDKVKDKKSGDSTFPHAIGDLRGWTSDVGKNTTSRSAFRSILNSIAELQPANPLPVQASAATSTVAPAETAHHTHTSNNTAPPARKRISSIMAPSRKKNTAVKRKFSSVAAAALDALSSSSEEEFEDSEEYSSDENASSSSQSSNEEESEESESEDEPIQPKKKQSVLLPTTTVSDLRSTNNNARGIIKNGDTKQSAAVSCTAQSTLLQLNGEERTVYRSSNAPAAQLNDENVVNYDQQHNNDIALANFTTSNSITHPGSVPEKMKTTQLLKKLLKSGKLINLGDKKVKLIKELGEGTYGSAWLVHYYLPASSQPKLCALKVQLPSDSLPLEFIIQSTLEYRIGNQNDGRFPFPLPIELHNFEGGSLFFMSAELGVTLHSIYPLWGSNCVPVEIVVYLADEMLTVLERLHCKGKYAHCDIKSDNAMIAVLPDGTCVIKLIDFGRAKSLTQLTSPLAGVAVVEDMMCKNMRLGKPWGVDQDFYGMATCLSMLLLKKEMTQSNTPIHKKNGTMELKEKFPRCTIEMWKKIFNKLLNFDARKYDETVKEVREELKAYITKNEKNVKAKLEDLKIKISSLDTSDRS